VNFRHMVEDPPGSKEAIAKGCKCPRIDNDHGHGRGTDHTGKKIFVYSLDCPLVLATPEEDAN